MEKKNYEWIAWVTWIALIVGLWLVLANPLKCHAQERVPLIPKYSSVSLYPGTGNIPDLFSLYDSESNWIQYDGMYNGEIDDSVPVGNGPFDSLVIDCKTRDTVFVRILYSTWDRGNTYELCDTMGPLSWTHSFPLGASHKFWPDVRNPGFIILQVPNATDSGAENPPGCRLYWGAAYLEKNVASVSPFFDPIKKYPVRWFTILGAPVDSTCFSPGFYIASDGRRRFVAK
jgi:hypothetical protein